MITKRKNGHHSLDKWTPNLVRDISETPETNVFINPNDNTYGGNNPCYTTVQEGIDGAQDGSSINIAQGTYTGS